MPPHPLWTTSSYTLNGPVLRVPTDPSVETPKGKSVFPSTGSRGALCSLIWQGGAKVTVREGIAVVLKIDEKSPAWATRLQEHSR